MESAIGIFIPGKDQGQFRFGCVSSDYEGVYGRISLLGIWPAEQGAVAGPGPK